MLESLLFLSVITFSSEQALELPTAPNIQLSSTHQQGLYPTTKQQWLRQASRETVSSAKSSAVLVPHTSVTRKQVFSLPFTVYLKQYLTFCFICCLLTALLEIPLYIWITFLQTQNGVLFLTLQFSHLLTPQQTGRFFNKYY